MRAAVTALDSLSGISWTSLEHQVASIDEEQAALEQIAELAEIPCAGGDTAGCAVLGLARLLRGGEEKVEQARIGQACDEGYSRACIWIGKFSSGDSPEAYAAYGKACALGDVAGCVAEIDVRLDYIGIRPEGAPCGMRMAHELCEAGHAPSCSRIGQLHLDGLLAPDPERALSYLERACGAGHQPSCELISALYGSRAEWQAALAEESCEPEPQFPPLTVAGGRIPRLATADAALVEAVRGVEKDVAQLLAGYHADAVKTAKMLSGNAQCRGRNNMCACRGPVSKCVEQSCLVTRNDGARLFIECKSTGFYDSRPEFRGETLAYYRVGSRYVRLHRLRDLFPRAGPVHKAKLVALCSSSEGAFGWSLTGEFRAFLDLLRPGPAQLAIREYADWRSARCSIPYAKLKPLTGCGPLAALTGSRQSASAPLAFQSAPLAWAAAGWEEMASGGADRAGLSSLLPSHQPAVRALNGWLASHEHCDLTYSSSALVSISCDQGYSHVSHEGKPQLGPDDLSRVVRLRDGQEIALSQVLSEPQRQLAMLAWRCFDNIISPQSIPDDLGCFGDITCPSRRDDPIDQRPALTMENIRGFTLTGAGVTFRIQAAVTQDGDAAVAHDRCEIPYQALGLSLASLGR